MAQINIRKLKLSSDATVPSGFSSFSSSNSGGKMDKAGASVEMVNVSSSPLPRGGFGEIAEGTLVPYVINVKSGEDIMRKLTSFAQGSEAFSILSATGTVSRLFIDHPASPARLVKYEGWFEILTLSGTFKMSKNTIVSKLSASFAKTNGDIFGGSVVGSLTASSNVQLVIGSSKQNRQSPEASARPILDLN